MKKAKTEKYDLHRQVLSLWKAAIDSGDFEQAIKLDFYHYNNLVKATEDTEFWDRWQDDTYLLRVKLVDRSRSVAPDRMNNSFVTNRKFAIVHHNYSGLAHEVQLSRNIQYLRQVGKPLDFDVIYLFSSVSDAAQRAAALYQIPKSNIIFLSADSYEKAGERLDLVCRQNEYCTVIYPSIFILAFWMSLFNPHPNQKFLQMKYYPSQVGRIAQWAGGRRTTDSIYTIRGFDFLQLETLDLNLPSFPNESNIVVDETKVTFGSISRPEKVADSSYNQFIKSLLLEYPNLNYLYAGRPEAVNVIPEFVRGLPNSTPIGWVNPAEAIRKYVIYLEPFPWGGGEMSFLALSTGVPYLALGTEENIRFGMFDFLRLIASSGPEILQFSFCATKEELRSRLLQLVHSALLRRQLGDSWRQHVKSWHPTDVERWNNFLTC